MIQLENICFSHIANDGTPVPTLHNLDMHIKENEFVSIVGPSGCGKTTLLEIILGLTRQDAGNIHINGATKNQKFGWAGYMSQSDTLLPWRTVIQNVQIGPEIKKIPKAEYEPRINKLIEKVGLTGIETRFPSELSGGMKKRVDLIRTLAFNPKVLLLDEPFGALDAQTRENLQQDLLSLWRDEKKTIVFITHDLVEAIMMSDRIFLMDRKPAGIKKIFDIQIPRPRYYHVQFEESFIRLHKQIRQTFEKLSGN